MVYESASRILTKAPAAISLDEMGFDFNGNRNVVVLRHKGNRLRVNGTLGFGARLCESQQRGSEENRHEFLCRLNLRSCCGSQTHAPVLLQRGNVIQTGVAADVSRFIYFRGT